MPIKIARGKTDEALDQVRDALEVYQQEHHSAEIALYRQNAVSIRIKVVDPDFDGIAKSARHSTIWEYIQKLPDEVQSDVSMLVLLTPREVKKSVANLEFEDPSPSLIQ
jgi:stress-induced morphogen